MTKSIPNIPYSTSKLASLMGEDQESVDKMKAYILQYFYPTYHGLYFYDANEMRFTPLNFHDGQVSNYLPDGIESTYDSIEYESKGKPKVVKVKFNAKKWLRNDYFERYSMVLKLGSPAVDYEKFTINMMGKLLHTEPKAFDDYSDHCKLGVQHWLDHIKDVWCSGKVEQYEFILDWISCTGNKKVKCALYLQSLEQTGKSMVVDFLTENVFGDNCTLVTSSIETIKQYTAPLEGKVLVNINELPCASSGEWMAIMNKMKSLVTDNKFGSREMYHSDRQTVNTFNMILTSNNDAVHLQSTNFKRYKCPDVSNSRIGDFKYFNRLGSFKTNEVGECFYAFLQERYHSRGKSINVDSFPNTDTFKDKICERLDLVYEFLKFEFIKPKKTLCHPLKELYAMYLEYWNDNAKKGVLAKSNMKFSKALKDINAMQYARKTVDVNGKKEKCLVFECNQIALHKHYHRNGWIHELDDIEEPETTINVFMPSKETESVSSEPEVEVSSEYAKSSEPKTSESTSALDIGVNMVTFD